MLRRRREQPDEPGREPSSSGWDAITNALDAVYTGVEPLHLAPMPGPAFGGGVQGISAYPAASHWHLVTYGLSELYQKQSDDPERSGWGYELTIRVGPRGDEPPTWAFNLLERIAQETRRAGTVFGVGHRLDSAAPIDGEDSQACNEPIAVAPNCSVLSPDGLVGQSPAPHREIVSSRSTRG